MVVDKKWVTNLHSEPQEYELSTGGFEMLQPGESKSLALARPNSGKMLGEIQAGLTRISDKEPKSPAVEPPSAEVAVTKSAEVAAAIDPTVPKSS